MKIYSGEYFNYRSRFLKQSIPVIVLAILVLTLMFSNPIFRNELNYWIIVLFILGTLIFFANRNAKDYVFEIELDESKILLRGETYNSNWNEILDLNNIELKFKFIGSRFTVKYILILKSGKNSFQINEYQDWNYKYLIEIFERIKAMKNEKISADEKIILKRIQDI